MKMSFIHRGPEYDRVQLDDWAVQVRTDSRRILGIEEVDFEGSP